jgi:hypothetical protein
MAETVTVVRSARGCNSGSAPPRSSRDPVPPLRYVGGNGSREVLSPEPMLASRVFRRFIQLDVTDDGRPVEISAQNIVPMVTIGSYGPRGTSRKTTASPPGNHIAGVFVAARHTA